MIKTKICGLKTKEDIVFAASCGVDLLGFVFVKRHRHYIEPETLRSVVPFIPKAIKKVGIFINEDIKIVKEIVERCGLDFVQLHGDETRDYCRQVAKFCQVIKACKVPVSASLDETRKQMRGYPARYFVLDRASQGEGASVRQDIARAVALEVKIFLAGGLTPDNVSAKARFIQPFGVDVSSGIETDGKTDKEKMRQFIREAQYA